MGKIIDMTGMRFERLVVIERADNDKYGQARWRSKCDCGNVVIVPGYRLRNGYTKSCGCLSSDKASERLKTHGLSKDNNHKTTRIYRIYSGMKNRCFNVKSLDYPNYGGRGITVCDEWRNSFEAFYNWAMDNGYNDNLSIDRINPNGNYEPINCRWVANDVQARNKCNTPYLTYKGETKPLAEWAEIKGVSLQTLHYRLKSGWTTDEILNVEVNHGNKITR